MPRRFPSDFVPPTPPGLVWLRMEYPRALFLTRPFRSCEVEYRDGFSTLEEEALWESRDMPSPTAREKLEYDWSQRYYVINGYQPSESEFAHAMHAAHQFEILTIADFQFRLFLGRFGAPRKVADDERIGSMYSQNEIRYVIQHYKLVRGVPVAIELTAEQKSCVLQSQANHGRNNVSHLYSTAGTARGLQADIDGGGGGGTLEDRLIERNQQYFIESALDTARAMVQLAREDD